MAVNCAACCKATTASHSLECSKCKDKYHALCVNITDVKKLPDSFKQSWVCPACQSKAPKKGNTNTPVRTSGPADDPNSNVTMRSQGRKAALPVTPPPSSPVNDSLTALVTEIKLLRADMCEVKEQLKNLSLGVGQCTSRIDLLEAGLARSDAQLNKIENQEYEIGFLKQRVASLEEHLNVQEQHSLRNEVEIMGLPELPKENPHHIVLTIANKIGINLNENDIDFVSRVGQHSDNGASAKAGKSYPRALVVRFTRNNNRNTFLKAGKLRRNLTSTDIGVGGPPHKLFFNERLTKINRLLFRDVRMRKESAGFKFCWISNGVVLVRRREGAKPIVIRRVADLDRWAAERPPSDSTHDATTEVSAGAAGTAAVSESLGACEK